MGKKEKNKLPPPDIFVSESELTLDEPALQAILNRMGLEYLLHHCWGFDNTVVYESTGKFYETSHCEHRTRGGKIVTGTRIEGRERLDTAWIKQGNPSEEAKVAARNDLSYNREIASLGRQMKSL